MGVLESIARGAEESEDMSEPARARRHAWLVDNFQIDRPVPRTDAFVPHLDLGLGTNSRGKILEQVTMRRNAREAAIAATAKRMGKNADRRAAKRASKKQPEPSAA